MKLQYSKEIILNILNKKPDLGKTAVMKIIFILQHVFDVNLGYNFDIYTYGPYAAEVTDELEALIYEDFIKADIYTFNNYLGYKLNISEKGESSKGTLSTDDEQKINKVLLSFGDKKAKELELDSTIIYIRNLHMKNKWGDIKEDIIKDVREIKPHFSNNKIGKAYDNLKNSGMLI